MSRFKHAIAFRGVPVLRPLPMIYLAGPHRALRNHRPSRRGGSGAVLACHASTAGARQAARVSGASCGPSAGACPAAVPAAVPVPARLAPRATAEASAYRHLPAPSASRTSPVHLIPSHHRRAFEEPGTGYQPGGNEPDITARYSRHAGRGRLCGEAAARLPSRHRAGRPDAHGDPDRPGRAGRGRPPGRHHGRGRVVQHHRHPAQAPREPGHSHLPGSYAGDARLTASTATVSVTVQPGNG